MGLYGKIVQSPEYRDAKLRTVIEMLPDLLGPSAEPFDLRFTGPDGAEYRGAQLVLVSNNRYELDPVGAQGTRGKMNHGTLGVVVAARGPFRPWREWTTPSFEVNSASTIETGVDGEALALDPPLRFEVLPSSLRIRVHFAGVSRDEEPPRERHIRSPARWTATRVLRSCLRVANAKVYQSRRFSSELLSLSGVVAVALDI